MATQRESGPADPGSGADDCHSLGIAALRAGDAERALDHIRRAVALRPEHATYRSNLGTALWRLGRREAAEQCFQDAVVLAPDRADMRLNLGRVLNTLDRPQEAEPHCRAAVEHTPEQPEAWRMLGRTLQALKHLSEAESCYRSAIRFGSDAAPFIRSQIGCLLYDQGRFSEAEAEFRLVLDQLSAPEDDRTALLRSPASAAFQNNLGNALKAQGRLAEAEASYRAALDLAPNSAAAANNLALVLLELGRREAAAALCQSALAAEPDHPAIHFNLANILYTAEDWGAAEHHYREALRLQPDLMHAYSNLGCLLTGRSRFEEAEACYREAVRLQPGDPDAYKQLGVVLWEREQLAEAEDCYREVLRLKPGTGEAHNNLGAVLMRRRKHEEAELHFRSAIAVLPKDVRVRNNLAVVLRDLDRLEEAEVCSREALQLAPDDDGSHMNLAFTLLQAGRLAEAWPEYEWRRKQMPDRGFDRPLWDGGATEGRILLIHAEQGFGDTLQFCRYLPLAAAGRRVVLEIQPPLLSLLAGLPGLERIVAQGDPLPDFDLHCPLISLPHALRTGADTMPEAIPYLAADPGRVAAWRPRVAALPGLRVGLVWGGNADYPNDRNRSIALARLQPLASVSGVSFVSLQKGPPANQAPPDGLMLIDWTAELHDFGDTAALIETLDLVISVDTAVAHLAGALGKPVWLLNRFDTCWRWAQGSGDKPWYPSLRQFRQPSPGAWDAAIDQMRQALTAATFRVTAETRLSNFKHPTQAKLSG
jgi:tetratricopeptide (TPR) repeat protein